MDFRRLGRIIVPAFATSAENIMLMIPKLTLEEAQAGMKPLTDFDVGKNLAGMSISLPLATDVSTIRGFYSFFAGSGGGVAGCELCWCCTS
jgi:hypothetical protein